MGRNRLERFSFMLRKLCGLLTEYLPSFTISKDNIPYLTRYYFFGKDRLWCNIFLHHFQKSDMDMGEGGFGLLHSHPWPFSFGLILVNGYSEERRLEDGSIVTKVVKPGSINFITRKDFHRVDLLKEDAWSLFFTGWRSENQDWYFWDRISKKTIFWREVAGAIE